MAHYLPIKKNKLDPTNWMKLKDIKLSFKTLRPELKPVSKNCTNMIPFI